jgi:uncharacterized protein (TIGR00369 family)
MYATVASTLERQPFMATLGVTLEHVAAGEVELRLVCSPALLQHTGSMHAGAITAVVDSACGAAAATRAAADRVIVSVEFKVNLLAPAVGDYIKAIGRVVRAGRTLTVCSGEAWAVTGADAVLVAVMQATMMAVPRAAPKQAADNAD